jgi:hypothetical protein
MTNGWRQPYAQLKGFVSEHQEIEIGEKIVRIPDGPRLQFYELFDKIGATLLQESFPDVVPETKLLGESCAKAKGELSGQLKLSHVLEKFLDDPEASLLAELFEITFDLVKGKVSPEVFEETASAMMEASSQKFYRLGYEKWVEVSLARLLDPDRILYVPLPKTGVAEKFKQEFPSKHAVPRPKDNGQISLEREVFPVFTTPDFIVHSAKLHKFAAVASEIVSPAWAASNVSRRRKWYPFEDTRAKIAALGGWPDISVYVNQRAADLVLVADSRTIARPDIIIECLELEQRREHDLEKARLQHEVLKPKLGSFIVSRIAVSRKERRDLGEGIRLLTVGFDSTKLRPIVDSLTGSKKARKPLSR